MAVAGVKPLAGLSDTGIAMLAAMALFVIPVDRAKGIRAMDWHTAVKLPWGVLMLFGGGLTLATAIETNGVSAFIGNSSRGLAGLPPPAAARDHHHDGFLVRAHLQYGAGRDYGAGARCHVAGARDEPLRPDRLYARRELRLHDAGGNAPNAIVFGTGLVRLPQMMKAGFWLNLAGILLITALVTLFITPLLGNEGWQSSKVHEGYSRGAHQGQASMQRMGGPDER